MSTNKLNSPKHSALPQRLSMSRNLLTPLPQVPLDLAQVQSAIIRGLAEFGQIAPAIWYQTSKSGTHDLEDGNVKVQGRSPQDGCCVTFHGLDSAAREPAESDLAYMACVAEQGSFWFAGAVAFGLAKNFGGRTVYDDRHLLADTDRYSINVLRRLLKDGRQVSEALDRLKRST